MYKFVVLTALTCWLSLTSLAAPTENGIIVYAEGERTCYLFDQMPTVCYQNDAKGVVAALSIKGQEVPVLTLRLEGDAQLVIEYGEVEESDNIRMVTPQSECKKEGKFFMCGRLVIVKDGKMYRTDGTRINIQQ